MILAAPYGADVELCDGGWSIVGSFKVVVVVAFVIVGWIGAVFWVDGLMGLDSLLSLLAVIGVGEGGKEGLDCVRMLWLLPSLVLS